MEFFLFIFMLCNFGICFEYNKIGVLDLGKFLFRMDFYIFYMFYDFVEVLMRGVDYIFYKKYV